MWPPLGSPERRSWENSQVEQNGETSHRTRTGARISEIVRDLKNHVVQVTHMALAQLSVCLPARASASRYISSSAYHIVADNAQPQTLSISRASNEISLTGLPPSSRPASGKSRLPRS